MKLIIRPLLPLSLVLATLYGCSGGRSNGPITEVPSPPGPDTPSASTPTAAPEKKPTILPVEKQALEKLDKSLKSVPKAADNDPLTTFQFTSEEALRLVESSILSDLRELARGSKWDPRGDGCLFLRQVFWNRVAAADNAKERDKALARLRPWLEDILAQGSYVLSGAAKLALTLYPDWRLPSGKGEVPTSSVYDETQCNFDKPPYGTSWHPLEYRLKKNRQVLKETIRLSGGDIDDETGDSDSAEKITAASKKVQALGSLIYGDPAVARRALENTLFNRKLVAPPQKDPLITKDPGIPPMQWRYQASASLGRCFGESPTLNGSSLHDFHASKQCTLNGGTPGLYSLGVGELETSACSIGFDTRIPCFRAFLFSYARGGRRDGGGIFSGQPAEDQTTRIQYDANGSVTIPTCNNPAVCSPTLVLTLERGVTDDSRNPINGLGTSDFVEVRSPALGGSVRLTPDKPLLVDRSDAQVSITISLSRAFTHVGASGEPPTLLHYAHLSVHSPDLDEPDFLTTDFQTTDESATLQKLFTNISDSIYERPSEEDDIGVRIALRLAKGLSQSPSNFKNHLFRTYGRLFAIQSILEEKSLALSATGRHQLELARISISEEARHTTLPTLRLLVEDRKHLLELIPEDRISKEISRLMALATDEESYDLNELYTVVRPLVTALTDTNGSSPELKQLAASDL